MAGSECAQGASKPVASYPLANLSTGAPACHGFTYQFRSEQAPLDLLVIWLLGLMILGAWVANRFKEHLEGEHD